MWPFTRRKRQKSLQDLNDQTVLARVTQLLRANIHAALDQAEDPEKMLDQFVRDYEANINAAEGAVAEAIAQIRMLEADAHRDRDEHALWTDRAQAASDREQAAIAAGNTKDQTRYNRLLTQALQKQVSIEQNLAANEPKIASQNEVAEQLKDGLALMKDRLHGLKTQRNELIARARTSEAQDRVIEAVASVNTADPTSQISRFEHTVRQREALTQGRLEVAAASLDNQFAELDASGNSAIVAQRMEALRRGERPELPVLDAKDE